ncbi:hypothetical protein [Kineococcus glutinatus]|uniref:hypothetical protein n=1 Tax=Kineococcus glutinatus TaxID=1070872 RepID=UPI0031ECFE24
MAEEQICMRCTRPVALAPEDYELFERMHGVCFHYDFEHDADVDADCGVPGCPSGLLPPGAPGPAAQQALADVAGALAGGWRVEPQGPAELLLTRGGDVVRVLVAEG